MIRPHELICIFEEIQSDILQFHYYCEDVGDQVSDLQNRFEEVLYKNKQQGDGAFFKVNEMKEEVGNLKNLTQSFGHDYDQTKDRMNKVNKKVCFHSCEIELVLTEWKTKKNIAQIKLDEAKKSFQQASNTLKITQAEYEDAYRESDRAYKKWECHHNDTYYDHHSGAFQLRDPGLVAWLYGAHLKSQSIRRRCENSRNVAQAHFDECHHKRDLAIARFTKCRNNVQVASDSKAWSDKALYSSQMADTAVSKEKKTLESTYRNMNNIDESVQEQVSCIDMINDYLLRARSETNSSKSSEVQVKRLIHKHEGFIFLARQKLEERIDLLEQFDHEGDFN